MNLRPQSGSDRCQNCSSVPHRRVFPVPIPKMADSGRRPAGRRCPDRPGPWRPPATKSEALRTSGPAIRKRHTCRFAESGVAEIAAATTAALQGLTLRSGRLAPLHEIPPVTSFPPCGVRLTVVAVLLCRSAASVSETSCRKPVSPAPPATGGSLRTVQRRRVGKHCSSRRYRRLE